LNAAAERRLKMIYLSLHGQL